MVFSSLVFLFYFLPVVLVLYALAPRRGKNAGLFAASLLFYAWGEPVYLFLMLFSILANYLFGLSIHRALAADSKAGPAGDGRHPNAGEAIGLNAGEAIGLNAGEAIGLKAGGAVDPRSGGSVDPNMGGNEVPASGPSAVMRPGRRARRGLILACALNLVLLGFFKYADFFIVNLNLALGLHIARLNLPLPLGISFYTFQAMSYIIDLYRGKVEVQKSLVAFGTYVALFPQLIAGPIVRFQTIAEGLTRRSHSLSALSQGALRFTAGLGKKVLLANSAGAVFEQAMQAGQIGQAGAGISVLSAWIGVLAFTMQIYFDFSGYSDMAIGLGRMFGFHFPENFDYPYISKSITEFWRRWHITLSSWFREYVYIPLGGNRRGTLLQLRNIAVVWALTGIWHGASWNFLVWGMYFGVLLIAEKLFLLQALERTPALLRHVYTMFFVIVSWAVFSANDLSGAAAFLASLSGFSGGPLTDEAGLYLLQNNILFFPLLLLGATPIPKRLWDRLNAGVPDPAAALIRSAGMTAVLLLSVAYLVSSSYNPFLYFRF